MIGIATEDLARRRAITIAVVGVHRHDGPVLGQVAREGKFDALRFVLALEAVENVIVDRLGDRRVLLSNIIIRG